MNETDVPSDSEPITEADAVTETTEPTVPDAPQDAAAWKAALASVSTRDLFRVVQRDKMRSTRVFQGFRAEQDKVRNPMVVARLADEAMRAPLFATEIMALTAAEDKETDASKKPAPKEVTPPPAKAEAKPDTKLREQLDKQRAALKEKDERIAQLEASLSQASREREAARLEADKERTARKNADEEVDRQKRHREREVRRLTADVAEAERKRDEAAQQQPALSASVLSVPVTPAVAGPGPFEEALRRLLSRGKSSSVAEICREAIVGGNLKDTSAIARGGVYSLYAASLYGQAEPDRGADQDQRACVAFLDAGDVAQATESFVRILSEQTSLRHHLTGDDTTLLRRLLALAERNGQTETIRTEFLRLRRIAPPGFALLERALQRSGKKWASFLSGEDGNLPTVGPDEIVVLPATLADTLGISSVTARRMSEAVDAGDVRFVHRVRDAIIEMRRLGNALGDALLTAVAELHRGSVFPYDQPAGVILRGAVVDASNVARFDPDPLAMKPVNRLGNLHQMRDHLLRRAFFPVLFIADANLRYHIDDKSGYLDLMERGILRETPGESADETLIAEARERDATLITNDRLSEWGDAARRIERFGFTLQHSGVSLMTP